MEPIANSARFATSHEDGTQTTFDFVTKLVTFHPRTKVLLCPPRSRYPRGLKRTTFVTGFCPVSLPSSSQLALPSLSN